MTQNDDDFVEVEPAQPGRKRDHSRDAEILDATLEVLAEVGAARLRLRSTRHPEPTEERARWQSPPRHCCEEMNTLFDDMVSLAPLC